MISEIMEDKVNGHMFYTELGNYIKYGIHKDSSNRAKLSEFLRFYSTKSSSELISLKEYLTRMKEGQEFIYYICGATKNAVNESPFLKALKNKGLEVLLMWDPMDEYTMQQLKEFEGKKFKNISIEGLELPQDEDEKDIIEELKEATEFLCTVFKDILGEQVEKVIASKHSYSFPCVIVTGEFGWTANMERIMKAQAHCSIDMGSYMTSKKTLKINPTHPIVVELQKIVELDDNDKTMNDKTMKDIVWVLYETALLASGFALDEPTMFANRVHRMLMMGLDIESVDEDTGYDME